MNNFALLMSPLHMVQRNALVYSHVWRGSVFASFLTPTLFLVAIGMGLGPLIDAGGSTFPGGVEYREFLAPGLLAAAAMQNASFESSYPIAGKITWHRNYEAINATPMRVVDIVLGELVWFAVRLTTVAVTFTIVMTAFGIPRSWLVLLAIPSAVLTGLAFSAPIMAYAVTLKTSDNSFNVLFRFGITPLFLFSGVFFPVSRLPEWLQMVAWFTPLFHGVELVRGFTLNTLESPAWFLHLAYLFALLIIGTLAALRTFGRRLQS